MWRHDVEVDDNKEVPMGLDMYLRVERSFKKGTAAADSILAAVGGAPIPHDEEEPGLYLSGWEFSDSVARQKFASVLDAAGLTDLATDESPSAYVIDRPEEVAVLVTTAYWRKANAIHGWFVTAVQSGTDDCGEYPVTWEQLAMLKSQAEAAHALYVEGRRGAAADTLPPTAGFFFGSTEVDEWYDADLVDTINKVDGVLRKLAPGDRLFYHSSW